MIFPEASPHSKRYKSETWLALGGYLLTSLLYLMPLTWHWLSYVPGDNGDSITNLWPFWYYAHALISPWPLFHSPLQFYPDGISMVFTSGSPLGAFLMSPVTLTIGAVAALNTWLLLHLWLGSFLFFRFCRVINVGRLGSWLGGFAYGCSPFVAVHLPGHYTLVQIGFTSGAMLSLAVMLSHIASQNPHNRPWISAITLALCCWAVAVTDFYLTIMTIFLLLLVLLHFAVTSTGRIFANRKFWVFLFGAAVACIAALTPWILIIIHARSGHDYGAIDPSMGSKNVATWSRLVTIPAYHSVWEPHFYREFLGKLSIFNEWTYLGMVGFLVAGVGLLYIKNWRRSIIWIIGFLLTLGMAGSNRYTLEPAWSTGPLSFGRWWPEIFPLSEFRVPARWHFALCTILAVGIALGSDALLARINKKPPRSMLALAIFALMAFDLLRWPLPICNGAPEESPVSATTAGTVLDIPVGVISGQGYILGKYDKKALLRQMAHGRPILSANVSRLPGDIISARQDDPELMTFLSVQNGDAITTETAALNWPGFRERYNLTTILIPSDLATANSIKEIMTLTGNRWTWLHSANFMLGQWK